MVGNANSVITIAHIEITKAKRSKMYEKSFVLANNQSSSKIHYANCELMKFELDEWQAIGKRRNIIAI